MKFWTTSKHQRAAAKYAAAGLMVVLWVGTFLLASSPELHRRLHPDAQNPDHHCLVTQIKEHSLFTELATLPAPVLPSTAFVPAPSFGLPLLPERDLRLSPSRAPPSVFSSATVAG